MVIGMGMWGIGGYESLDYLKDNESVEVLRYGFEFGINFIDIVEFYGVGYLEEFVGEVIKEFECDDIFIISKVWLIYFGYEEVKRVVRVSVKRLGIYIDFYFFYWFGDSWEKIKEMFYVLEEFVDEGLIRYIGVSNFDFEFFKRS